ncbi:Uncharacterised protein [Mycobacteroides abscessus subsp. abscessus]|nr:Uncharacterised protein [Mycobacteroides abscessus subsp. abscessus]
MPGFGSGTLSTVTAHPVVPASTARLSAAAAMRAALIW